MLVSIGLPVYNGENYLEEAILSILKQTHDNFELIICDNASTDRTEEISRSYQDHRIRYYGSEANRGAAWNYNRTFMLARGDFFKWAAHDDKLAPGFVATCLATLQHNPDTVLAYTCAREIDESGNDLGPAKDPLDASSACPSARFASLILSKHSTLAVFGVGRTATFRRTALHGNYNSADRVFLAHMGLLGKILRAPEPLFLWRRHPGQSMNMLRDRKAYAVWFDPKNRGKLILPASRLIYEYLRLLNTNSLSFGERTSAYGAVLRCCLNKRREFINDLFIAGNIAREALRS